jgi:hypothetical protein
MRSVVFALVALSATAGAQVQDSRADRSGLPRDVANQVTRLYNDSAALRSTGRVDVEEGRDIDGNVAVIDGPLYVGGRIRGRVVAINSDVVLRPTARIDGDLLVVGGEVEGRHSAHVGGEIRIYRQTLEYERDGDLIIPRSATTYASEVGWWRRWERTHRRNSSKLYIATAGAYNRVEGLPINLGPQILAILPWGSVRLDAYAIMRTESSFNGGDGSIGHNVSTEVRFGRRGGMLVGGRVFNTVDPTETWQLSQSEASLSAFLLRRDYRDYFERRGGQVQAGFFVRRGADVTVSYGDERWLPRQTQLPWTLFMQGAQWRPNPEFDAGRMHLLNSTLRVDTRNDEDSPWSGWYVTADLEHGFGHITQYAPRSDPIGATAGPDVRYARAFLDLRRYNRVTPDARLNFRVVAGGWMNGDPLPLQRRFAVDGPGGVPGYDFRTPSSANLLTCTSGALVPGIPGQCDRMALAQVEYRGDLHFDLFTDWEDDDYMRSHADGMWVFFADAGRGWLVGPAATADELTYDRNVLPPLSTFRTDLGIGLDFDLFGVYVAKSMSSPNERPNFFLRVRHRF